MLPLVASQVNSDWLATSGVAQILNKPSLFNGAYSSLTGVPSTFTPSAHTHPVSEISDATTIGQNLVKAASQGAARMAIGAGTSSFDGAYSSLTGTPATFTPSTHTHPVSQISDSTTVGRAVVTATDQAAARTAIGAGTSSFDGAYTSLSGLPLAFTPSAHTQAFSTITSTPTTLSGYGITDGVTASSLSTTLGGYATSSALTTGLAGKFNTPTGTASQCVRGDGSVGTCPAASAVTSVTAGTGLSGGTITSTGTIALTNVGTADTYVGVTTDAQGRVVSGTKRTVNKLTKALNTCFQVSTTQNADVLYNVEIVSSGTLIGGQKGTAYLETFTDSACTTGTVEIMRSTNGNTTGLAVALGNVSTTTLTVQGPIDAGLYGKIRTSNDTGTPTFTARPGWEKLN